MTDAAREAPPASGIPVDAAFDLDPIPRPVPVLVSTMPDLVSVLRRAREQRGLSQADVAEALRVTHTSVSHWERGAYRPAAGLLIGWARVVGMPLWLIPEERADV